MNSKRSRDFKNALFQQLARTTKAMASPRRLEIIDLLAQGERSVEEIARLCEMSMANASQHLQELRTALLVQVRRSGLHAYYRLADEGVFRTWQAIRDLGQRQFAEIDRLSRAYLSEREEFERIGVQELMRRIREDEVVVLDVRPEVEFESGHIRGARSIPVAELRRRIAELPKGKEVIAYCRGPFCVYADEAASLLRRRGFKSRRLDVGYPDWRSAGLPVAVGKKGRS